jgi:pterin-4a-carbinolamine dehydratase
METMERVVSQRTVVNVKLRRVPHPSGGLTELVAGGPDEMDLKPERVQEWLQAWPAWQLAAKGRMIQRTRVFPAGETAAHYGGLVTSLARALALPVTVDISERRVRLSLYAGHQGGGSLAPLTAAVLDFATQLG